MSNSVEPDEAADYEPSYLSRCLQKPIIIAYSSKRVKRSTIYIYGIWMLIKVREGEEY